MLRKIKMWYLRRRYETDKRADQYQNQYDDSSIKIISFEQWLRVKKIIKRFK